MIGFEGIELGADKFVERDADGGCERELCMTSDDRGG